MNLTTDIAVVGGGPAGAIAALRLARLGHAVVLLHDACGRRRPACETFAEQLAFLGLAAVLDRSAIRSAAEVELCWGRG
jgi:flavin-dependent dehydrogenase